MKTARLMGVCPHAEVLRAFSLGRLTDAELDDVERHLAECEGCQAVMRSLSDTDDSLVGVLRNCDAAYSEEPAWRAAAQELKAVDPDQVRRSAERQVPARLGPYQLIARIGQGGMGAVYKARHLRLKRWVAVKLLAPKRLSEPQALARFHKEMEAVGQLDHPNLIRAHDADEVDGHHFLAMEYVDGVDLARLSEQLGPLPVAEACELVRQAALGLAYAHAKGMIHRDLKPSNVMVTRGGVVKVLDLGLAQFVSGRGSGDSYDIAGSLPYMAPEQRAGAKVDERADVYALALTLLRLLCGEHQAWPSNQADRQTRADAIQALCPTAPAALCEALADALAWRAEERLGSAAAFSEILATYAEGADLKRLISRAAVPIDETRDRVGSATVSFAIVKRKRHRLSALTLVCLAVLGAAGFTALLLLPRRTPDPSEWETPSGATASIAFSQAPADEVHWQYDAGKDVLRLVAPQMTLLRVGKLTNPRFRIHANVNDTGLPDGSGIMLGYDPPAERTGRHQFYSLAVNRHPTDADVFLVKLIRVEVDGATEFSSRDAIISAPVRGVVGQFLHTIQLSLDDNGQPLLWFDDRPLPRASWSKSDARLPDIWWQGDFGLFSCSEEVTVQDFHVTYQ